MPDRGRPFTKKASGNPGGRPKVLGNVKELARQKSSEAIETLSKIMLNDKATDNARVRARGGTSRPSIRQAVAAYSDRHNGRPV